MTYKTHKQFSVAWAFIAAIVVYKMGLSEISYYLSIPIIILVSKYGALFPDVDHHWKSVKEKNVPNWIINKLIHITGGRHRSWQTHSLDILITFGVAVLLIPSMLFGKNIVTDIDREVLNIILISFWFGWASHLFADMMSSKGVRLFFWWKHYVKFVPKKIGSFSFSTDSDWENMIFNLSKGVNTLFGIVCIIYPKIDDGTIAVLIEKITNNF